MAFLHQSQSILYAKECDATSAYIASHVYCFSDVLLLLQLILEMMQSTFHHKSRAAIERSAHGRTPHKDWLEKLTGL